jgi:hypothetical protein
MRKLALATTALPLLLGLAEVAQAGGLSPCTTLETAILECKSAKKGGFEVFAFTNDGGNASSNVEVGDDCTEALGFLANTGDGEGFFINEVSTGTPDRTIYTLVAEIDTICD